MAKNLIWMDLEMTGLNPDCHVILEIATTVTDDELEIVAEGPSLVIHQDESALAVMNEWSCEQHQKSGLIERVRKSEVYIEEAEAVTLEFVASHTEYQKSPLCGNSIWQDRRFLAKYMPVLEDWMHYRIIDVSTVKELASIWRPQLGPVVKKKNHLARDDILESIEELRYYHTNFFQLQ